MKFVLFSTHQVGRGRLPELLRLIQSVEQQDFKDQAIELHVLLQGTEQIPHELAQFADVHFHPHQPFVGLSKARNLLIKKVPISIEDFVLFPDDDCWYPAVFFSQLKRILNQRQPDMVLWSFSDEPELAWPEAESFKSATPTDAMRRGVSNAFGFKGAVVHRTGFFDETLGLGTPSGGGEDLDYAYRALRQSRMPIISRAKLAGHRSATTNFNARVLEMTRYWETAMYVTLAHFELRLTPLALYRFAVGIFLLLTRRISMKRFLWPFEQVLRRAS